MRHTQLILETVDIDPIREIIRQKSGDSYSNISDDMSVYIGEHYKFITNSAQADIVIINFKEGKTVIDVLGTAGGSGIFNISWWSESSFVNRMVKRIEAYCNENGVAFTKKRFDAF